MKMIEEDVINMYKTTGYSPDDVIKSLLQVLGCAILANGKGDAHYISDKLEVKVVVTEK